MTKEEAIDAATRIKELNASGYAGVLSTGEIVDRRKHPDAIPVQANAMFGVAEPKSTKLKYCMNFAEVNGKLVTIKHFSTSSTIEIIIQGSCDEHDTQTIYLDYAEFDSLVDCVWKILSMK